MPNDLWQYFKEQDLFHYLAEYSIVGFNQLDDVKLSNDFDIHIVICQGLQDHPVMELNQMNRNQLFTEILF